MIQAPIDSLDWVLGPGRLRTRPRQIVIMILKEWVAQYMMNSNIGQPINSFDEVFEMLDFENLWGYLFKCTAKYTWMECLIATESEIEEELAWALERPGVKLRHARADYSASARAEAKLCVLQSHFAAK